MVINPVKTLKMVHITKKNYNQNKTNLCLKNKGMYRESFLSFFFFLRVISTGMFTSIQWSYWQSLGHMLPCVAWVGSHSHPNFRELEWGYTWAPGQPIRVISFPYLTIVVSIG